MVIWAERILAAGDGKCMFPMVDSRTKEGAEDQDTGLRPGTSRWGPTFRICVLSVQQEIFEYNKDNTSYYKIICSQSHMYYLSDVMCLKTYTFMIYQIINKVFPQQRILWI